MGFFTGMQSFKNSEGNEELIDYETNNETDIDDGFEAPDEENEDSGEVNINLDDFIATSDDEEEEPGIDIETNEDIPLEVEEEYTEDEAEDESEPYPEEITEPEEVIEESNSEPETEVEETKVQEEPQQISEVIEEIKEETKTDEIPLVNKGVISFKGGELTLDEPFSFSKINITDVRINAKKNPVTAEELIIVADKGDSIILGNVCCKNLKITAKKGVVGIKGDIEADSVTLKGKVKIKGNLSAKEFNADKNVEINGTFKREFNVKFDESIFQ